MKKLFIIPLLISFMILPFQAFASVDITLEDKSTTEQKSVSVLVDTGTDVLGSISFKVQASDDVDITQVIDQNSTCEEFTYVDESNVITISCTLDEEKVLSAYVGTIIFTSTGDDYTFTILKNDGLDLGELTLGTVTDIEAEEEVEEEDTTTATTTTTPTTTSSTSSITKYLPYILIGGAVILLISVVGIIFSKKKEPKNNETPSTPETPVETTTVPETPAPAEEPATEPVKEELYTPTLQTQEPATQPEPTIQEALEQPIQEPVMPQQETPIETAMPTQEPIMPQQEVPVETPVSEQDQSSDLSALINAEQQTPAPMPAEQTPTPMETPTMPETPSQPLPDLQKLVNTQVQDEGIPVPASEDTVPQPTEEVPPAQQAM
ncbi:MAG: hypothetical protein PHE21_01100 [Candidatus Dojkabacteria bacterium]|nr:hypothetical protein [Candidatus Dojkabacteria bacterium]